MHSNYNLSKENFNINNFEDKRAQKLSGAKFITTFPPTVD